MIEELAIARVFPEIELPAIERFFKTHRGEKFKSYLNEKYSNAQHMWLGGQYNEAAYGHYTNTIRRITLQYAQKNMPKDCFYYENDLAKSRKSLRYLCTWWPRPIGVYVGEAHRVPGTVIVYEEETLPLAKLFIAGHFMDKPDTKVSFKELERYKKGMQHHVNVAQKYIDAVKEAVDDDAL